MIGVTKLRAQETVQDGLSYYPLQVGNEWQYHYQYLWTPGDVSPGLDSGYVDVKVTGDTLMNNSHLTYQIVSRRQYREVDDKGTLKLETSRIYYERVDSATANVYRKTQNGESLLDSLLIQKGDTITTIPYLEFTTCYDTTSFFWAGHQFHIKRLYWFDGGIAGNNHDLAKGIGIIYKYFKNEGTLGNTDTLIYALINGTQYGTRVDTPVEETPQSYQPSTIRLYQNYPNPFNPTTTIRYELARPGPVRLTVYNVLGQQVSVLVNTRQAAGSHQVTFNASRLGSGVFFFQLQAGDKVLVKKMLLMK